MRITLGLIFLALPLLAGADLVVPIDSVGSYVKIREAPEKGAEAVGRLHRSKPRPHVASVPGWHEVLLEDGTTGFVSADWTVVIPDDDEDPPAGAPVAPIAESVEGLEVPQDTPATTTTSITEGPPGPQGPAGPPGPPGPQGPPGPAAVGDGAAALEGRENFVVKFKEPLIGGTSQIWDDGNFVGIGTTQPKQRLEVNGSIQIHEQNSSVAGLMITQSSGDTGYILHNRASTLTIGSGSIDRITIDRDGNIGFGIDRPTRPLEMANGAYVSAGGVWTNASSRALKENVEALTVEQALAALADLEPVRFNYRSDDGEEHLGFIAEDVPALVATSDRASLSPMDVVAVLTKVIQAQQARIDELERRLGQ